MRIGLCRQALAAGCAVLMTWAAPVHAQDLFRGEASDPVMGSEIRDCLRRGSDQALQDCRFHVSRKCYQEEGTDADICFLREAASWDRAMRHALSKAIEQAQEADDFARRAGKPARAETLLLQSQALFESYRAIACDAEAEPYGPTSGEGARTYVVCLIKLTSDRALRLKFWGLI